MNKRIFFFSLVIFLSAAALSAEENIISVFENSQGETNLELCLKKGLEKLGVNLEKEISDDRLSAINFILKNTFENNIHKMRGEEDNQVFVKESGEEAVFDKDGNLVTNAWNRGSFNFGNYEKPIKKFELDIWPWLIWGNTREDPTTFEERFFYYMMDLDIGIQEYIFLEDKKSLEKIKYDDLTETDKLVCQFFNYLLFNESYKYDLSEKNMRNYRKSAENYWKYLSQLVALSGYKN